MGPPYSVMEQIARHLGHRDLMTWFASSRIRDWDKGEENGNVRHMQVLGR